jgi:hypothetical protein
MASIAKAQSDYNIPASRVLNLDESGIFYGVAQQHIFVPEGSRSGEVPSRDDKSRFTVELAATGDVKILLDRRSILEVRVCLLVMSRCFNISP